MTAAGRAEFLHGRLTPAIRQRAIDFWLREDALGDDQARVRADLLLGWIVSEGDGEILGVATGEIIDRYLDQPLYTYRTYIGRASRRQGLATALLNCCFDGLDAEIEDRDAAAAIGVILEYPRQLAAVLPRELRWPQTGFSLLGYVDDLCLRVRYFEQVRLRPAQPDAAATAASNSL